MKYNEKTVTGNCTIQVHRIFAASSSLGKRTKYMHYISDGRLGICTIREPVMYTCMYLCVYTYIHTYSESIDGVGAVTVQASVCVEQM